MSLSLELEVLRANQGKNYYHSPFQGLCQNWSNRILGMKIGREWG